MTRKSTQLFGEDEATQMLAKAIAHHAFRDPLEELHSGTVPESKTGNFSDVKVVTPYGDIPWAEVRRISEEEMKALMLQVVSKLYTLLAGLDDKLVRLCLCALAHDKIAKWDTPAVDEPLRQWVLRPSVSVDQNIINMLVATFAQCETDRKLKARET